MDKELLNSKMKTNVYQIISGKHIPLHKHQKFDEVFYCMKGEGYGVLEGEEQAMNVGDVFIVKENTMHSLRSESEMWVASILIPVVENDPES